MSLRRYFKPTNKLPTADEAGLSANVVNQVVTSALERSEASAGKNRKYTTVFTPDDRAAIGRYAANDGNSAAVNSRVIEPLYMWQRNRPKDTSSLGAWPKVITLHMLPSALGATTEDAKEVIDLYQQPPMPGTTAMDSGAKLLLLSCVEVEVCPFSVCAPTI